MIVEGSREWSRVASVLLVVRGTGGTGGASTGESVVGEKGESGDNL